MQKNSSESAGAGAGLVKYALLAFVAVSVGFAGYKIAAAPAEKTQAPAAAGLQAEAPPAAAKPARGAAVKKNASAAKTAVVYYFYTNTRCSSCKAIEEYTRAAVEKNFPGDYKGWHVVFKGVNTEDEGNAHFVQDYWLNSKSVVVQKFSGEKPLNWGRLDKVWQLLGDKEAFISYVTAETHKLLDEK